MKYLTTLLLAVCLPCSAQFGGFRRPSTSSQTATVLMSGDLASNSNSTTIVSSPARKQLGNFGTGCSGGVIQPSSDPVGQLYATSSIQSAAVSAGCASEGVVSVTSSGTGIAAPDNGHSAGGSDSATALTDTYGGTADDSICSGDSHNSDPTLFPGLAPAGCHTSASAYFSQTVVSGHVNSSVLFPTLWTSNSTTLDTGNWYMRSFYVMWDNVTTLWDSEHDVNINSSDTAYAQSGCSTGSVTSPCGYFGWGMHWGKGLTMFAYCPQGCSSWKKFIFKSMNGGSDLTSFTPTVNHWYHIIQYGHRLKSCSYGSSSNCYFYDFFTLYDVTAGGTPVTYYTADATTGNPAGGVPVNHSTWTNGLYSQVQLDSTTAGTTGMHIQSDITVIFSLR